MTKLDADAISGFSPAISAVMAETGARANVAFHETLLENTRVRGVTSEYEEFSGYAAQVRELRRQHRGLQSVEAAVDALDLVVALGQAAVAREHRHAARQFGARFG